MSARHGTVVSRSDKGVLIIGKSGSGKSQLALELMALGAELVADDSVNLEKVGQDVILTCPLSIRGKIEARGIGLLTVKSIDQARLAIVVDLDKIETERLPVFKTTSVLGTEFPLIYGKNCSGLGAVIWCLLGEGQLLPID